jgi:hypothetical protein
MKLLSPKNKKNLILAGALFAAGILAFAVMRAYNAGAKSAQDYWTSVSGDIKQFFSSKGSMILLLCLGLLGSTFFSSAENFVSHAVALGVLTTAANVVTTFNTTYIPKTFYYSAATQLTGVKITVQGDGVIFDSDANGLNHAGVSRVLGQLTNGFLFRLTNGFISNKNVIWEFTNSAAQTPTVYVDSDETPARGQEKYLQLLRQAVLANSGQNFSDFATLSLPSLAAGDTINILYRDGTQQQLNRVDIQAKLQWLQNVVNTPVYTIDNFAQTIKTVNIIAGAAQTAYIQRWVAPSGGGMINQTVNG